MAMPVVNLRHVGVIMQQRRMAVHVSMRLLDPQCLFMLVIVVVVVDVHVIMFHFLMAVRMGMMSSDKEYEANRHDSSRHGFTESPALTENGNRGQGADKGSRCQKSSLARGAMQTKGAHIQHQTHTVAEQTQYKCGDNNRGPRKGLAGHDRQTERTHSGAQCFDSRHHNGIAQGQSLTQVIVQRPREARAGDRDESPSIRSQIAWSVLENGSCDDDQQGADCLHASEV